MAEGNRRWLKAGQVFQKPKGSITSRGGLTMLEQEVWESVKV